MVYYVAHIWDSFIIIYEANDTNQADIHSDEIAVNFFHNNKW